MALLKILSDNYLKQDQLNAVVPQNERNGLGGSGSGSHDLHNCINRKKKKKKWSSALKQIIYIIINYSGEQREYAQNS
jgi:hypothetical protein